MPDPSSDQCWIIVASAMSDLTNEIFRKQISGNERPILAFLSANGYNKRDYMDSRSLIGAAVFLYLWSYWGIDQEYSGLSDRDRTSGPCSQSFFKRKGRPEDLCTGCHTRSKWRDRTSRGIKTVLKNKKNRETSISYGIGHAGFEVMFVLGVSFIMSILKNSRRILVFSNMS